ncbi:conserved hypothetical protein [Paraburkholderia sacchari]|uniref:hypothetical protein n=1 Tax=Paraburkholderia sacchari TaxID=159450 RepID=UPI0039A6C138
MSYLQFPRFAFTGKFQADVSTVNNDPRHFDNEHFEASFQAFQSKDAMNGWWNPTGTAIMRFTDCTVKSLRGLTGQLLTAPQSDPLIGCTVGNSLSRPAGKLVDLDTDWQLASNIYGLEVSLIGTDGLPIMTAAYESNPFRDLWFTRSTAGGDSGASAMFQSVLTNIVWHRELKSALLDQLRSASERDELSIRLSTYGYQQRVKKNGVLVPDFGYGILLGNIGPAKSSQPRSFILGRRFMPTTSNGAGDLVSGNGIGCFSSFVDEQTSTLNVDLSNALPLGEGYKIAPASGQPLQFAMLLDDAVTQDTELPKDGYIALGNVDQTQNLQDLEGGVQSLPLPGDLLQKVRGKPLAIVQAVDGSGSATVCVREAPHGLEVRADAFTFKLDPNDPAQNRTQTSLYAARYGEPCAHRKLDFWIGSPAPDYSNTPASGKAGATPRALLPINNVPGGLQLTPERAQTDEHGVARIAITGPESMGNPRGYIDGQLYVVSYNFAGGETAIQQPYDKLAIVVFSTFPARGQPIDLDNPRWEDVQPILQQYANLYPVMSQGLFDFSKREVADSAAFVMHFVFDKTIDDPDQMPVTRDLSATKRRMLINYFRNVMNRTGKTMDRQVLFGKRCPLRDLAGDRDAAPDLTGIATRRIGSKS